MNSSAGTLEHAFAGRGAHAETDRRLVHPDQTLVRDRHPMRIATQVFEHLLRAAERLFRVDHPVVHQQLLAQGPPDLLVGQLCHQRPPRPSGFTQRGEELAAKDL
jgi:hypothetical protein